ncbi:RNA-directed DNA polymerase [Chromobacterium vaccinii]|uniref:RNA-directed DNA polymerase n=1 Tax=Chromobacterium vaccinii TaxID=1108595 RepID=UPI001E35D49B|nr:RNA-directed DNA polymerase [Chromobacterium vaccinii]MCD4498157.1 RNA-directed DNA polymerase [Chromobacterium vaccinii]
MANDYQRLKTLLNIEKAAKWLVKDSEDDFFPDTLNFSDVVSKLNEYLSQRQHRYLQIDSFTSIRDFVPKANGMLRESVWLHPIHRLLYLATLHYLLPKLDHHIPSEVYSYRLDSEDADGYPFGKRLERWKEFHNDFRRACLDEQTGAVLITDIASFYDHIRVEDLATRIKIMLGAGMTEDDRVIVDFLQSLMLQWSSSGYGIPQNIDPSSFYGSLYLSGVDHEIIQKRYMYFRWVDDIRICARNKKQALRALHDLQEALSHHRMFLASDKTKIILRGTEEFDNLVDVEDDAYISQIEDMIARGERQEIETAIPDIFRRLTTQASPSGDDRKFRAYANRALQIGEFREFSENVIQQLVPFVVARMETHPNRSDYWTKLLQSAPNGDWLNMAEQILQNDKSVYNWQRFYVWRLLIARPDIPDSLKNLALSTAMSPISDLEAAQAILCYGKHANNQQRESLYAQQFSPQKSYPIQRAILLAIQEMHPDARGKLYKRAIDQCPEHTQLVQYIEELDAPKYGITTRAMRQLPEQPRPIEMAIARGIGKSNGQIIQYRLSRRDYDYD